MREKGEKEDQIRRVQCRREEGKMIQQVEVGEEQAEEWKMRLESRVERGKMEKTDEEFVEKERRKERT